MQPGSNPDRLRGSSISKPLHQTNLISNFSTKLINKVVIELLKDITIKLIMEGAQVPED